MYFDLYKDSSGQWRWWLVASNGRTVADSGESYTTKATPRNGISLVKQGAATASTSKRSAQLPATPRHVFGVHATYPRHVGCGCITCPYQD